jgi:hypothetical protein
MYKSGNPFQESDEDNKRLPQMLLLLLLSETLVMFGLYYIGYPFPTVSSVSINNYNYNGIGFSLNSTTNMIASASTGPVGQSYQPINLWIIGLVYSFVVAFLLIADAISLLNEGAKGTGL